MIKPKGWRGESRRHSEAARKKADVTANYERHRIFDPSRCKRGSFRNIDIGRPGFSKIIACRLKGDTAMSTQSILISKSESPEKKAELRGSARILRERARMKGL